VIFALVLMCLWAGGATVAAYNWHHTCLMWQANSEGWKKLAEDNAKLCTDVLIAARRFKAMAEGKKDVRDWQ
jgi:hypothetical protein